MFYTLGLILLAPVLVSGQNGQRNVKYFYPCANSLNCADPFFLNQHNPISLSEFNFLNRPISRGSRERLKNITKMKKKRQRLKKLSPTGTGTAVVERQGHGTTHACDGWENFLHDVELVLLGLTVVSFGMALFALVLHILNQAYIFFSVHIIGTPERLTWLIEQIMPGTIEENLHTAIEVIGFLDYLVIRWVSFPTGNWIVVIDLLAHIIGGTALFFDFLIPFEDVLRPILTAATGINLRTELAGWGCNNPFEAPAKTVLQNIVTGAFRL